MSVLLRLKLVCINSPVFSLAHYTELHHKESTCFPHMAPKVQHVVTDLLAHHCCSLHSAEAVGLLVH